MSEVMDSLVNDEFEIIEGAEDETNENEAWTMQQTIRIDKISLPPNYVFSPIENHSLAEPLASQKPSFETPILAGSVVAEERKIEENDKRSVASSINNTLHDVSIIPGSESSSIQPESLIHLNLEEAEQALKNSIIYVGELKKRLDIQTLKIEELKNSEKFEVEKLLEEQKEEFKKQMEEFETLKKEEIEILLKEKNEKIEKLMEEFEVLKKEEVEKLLKEQKEEQLKNLTDIQSEYSLKLRESEAIVEELKSQLAATSQCAQIWKENAEKHSYRDEKTIVDRLTEENKMLREKLDFEVAKRIEQTELRKMYENQLKGNAIDVPVSIIAKQLADKNDYALQLEKELMKIREELKNTQKTLDLIKEESTNHEQIVQVLREDQVESTRQLAASQNRIDELERICQQAVASNDNFGSM
ncbi:unnamed protein product [Caenorhabditis angaria]|uniref:Uncharacterized protein n=1 Tax=Caenorhabditis angaria TaxID=860376 RepID=A0A9P1ITK1_9PELO|nr:unnamed protein product [Caenorhabditis angaria]